MESDNSDPEPEENQTVALWLEFKVGDHIADFFTYSPDGSLTIESSPIGINVQKGDVIVRYFNDDVRGWTKERFEREKWLNLKETTRVKLLIFRKGYKPEDMDKTVRKKVSS